MTYDLLIKNGRVIDGTGAPAFNADIGIRNGKISEIGKLNGSARRTIDARGQVVAPGFIDSHTHYDAQLTWDPLATYSCYHGATTVIIGNCSLGIAPARPGTNRRVAEFLSYVEAIPMETLETVKPTWETYGQYLDSFENKLGVNMGGIVGHTPIRYYVMGNDSQSERLPTPQEIEQMKDCVREAMESGALGLSFSLNKSHYDPQGNPIPGVWAKEEELFALASVLGDMGTGILQTGQGTSAQVKNRLISRLSEATGRPFYYSSISYQLRKPDGWKEHMKIVDESVAKGIRAIPHTSPTIKSSYFNMHNCQMFKGVPGWHEVLRGTDEEKLAAYADPEFRKKVHHFLVEWPEVDPATTNYQSVVGKNWADALWVIQAKLEKNRQYNEMSVTELAAATGKNVIDALLDLVVEEGLDTEFRQGRRGFEVEIISQILNYPHTLIGLSDSGAHVQFHAAYGYSSFLLSHWVRRHKVMTVEAAVKKLSFDLAQAYGIYDRGLLQPGMAADIVVFDPDTIRALPQEKSDDFPGGAWRMKEMAEGVMCTIVNGQVIIEDGKPTGNLPGKVLRNALYREQQEAKAMGRQAATA